MSQAAQTHTQASGGLAERLLEAIALVREGARDEGMADCLPAFGGGTIEPFDTAGLSPGRLAFDFEPGFGLRFHLTVPVSNHGSREPFDPNETASLVMSTMRYLRAEAASIASLRSGIHSAAAVFLRETAGEGCEVISIEPGPVRIDDRPLVEKASGVYFRVLMLMPGTGAADPAREAYVIEAEDAETFARLVRG